MAKNKKKKAEEKKPKTQYSEEEMIEMAVETVAEYEGAYTSAYRDMYFMQEEEIAVEVPGKPSLPIVRDPAPHDTVNLGVDILSVLGPSIKVVVGKPTGKKRVKAWEEKHEEQAMNLTKALRAILQMSDRFQEGTLREIALRHGLIDGRMAVKVIDVRGQSYYREGSFPLMIQALDPFTVYPMRGVVGYDGFVEKKAWYRHQLQRMWPEFPAWEKKEYKEAEIVYFWEVWIFDERWYGISVSPEAEPETVLGPEKAWSRPPYAYRMVRHMATEDHEKEALSFLFGGKDINKFLNYMRTHAVHAAPKYLNQGWNVFTKDGSTIKFSTEAGAINFLNTNVKPPAPLVRGEIPRDFMAMLSMLKADMDRTTLPSSLTGEPVAGQVAGYLMAQYIATGKSRLNSWLQAMEHLLADVLTIAATQIKEGPGPVQLYYYGEEGKDRWFEEVGPDDIPEHFMVNVTVHPYFEQDKLQRMTAARMLRARGVHGWPLVDDELIREQILEMGEDVEIKERLIKEAAMSLQVVGPILSKLVMQKVSEKLDLGPAEPAAPTAMQGEQWMSNLPPELQEAIGGMGGMGGGMMPGPGEMPPEMMGQEGIQGMTPEQMQIIQMIMQVMRGRQPL